MALREPVRFGWMGFDGIDLIAARAPELDTYWREPELSRVRGLLDKHDLEAAQFVLFQNAVADLPSTDPDERARALDVFEKGCAVARRLGAPMVNIVAPWARALQHRGYLLDFGWTQLGRE